MTTHIWPSGLRWPLSMLQLGSLVLGAVILYISMYFVSRFGEYTTESLTAVVGVILGGTVMGVIGKAASKETLGGMVAAYLIGLGIGLALWIVLVVIVEAPAATAPFDYAVSTPAP